MMLWEWRYVVPSIFFGVFAILTVVINLIMISMFWCAAKVVIWTINATLIIGLFLMSAYLAQTNKLYGLAGICAIIAAIFLTYWLRNKITLVINIIQESTIILFKFWNLLLVPIVVSYA